MLYFFSLLLPIKGEINECLKDWGTILANTYDNRHNIYTEMLSYTGKNLNDLGRYQECTQIDEAKYVLLEFYKPPWFLISLCGPKSCSESDYIQIINSNTNFINVYLSSVIPDFPNNSTHVYFPSEARESLKIDAGRIIMTILVSILAVLGIIGTSVGIGYKFNKFKGYELITCFSIYENLKNLASRKTENEQSNTTFDMIDGIRVMCVGWVILGHVVMQLSIYSVVGNIYDLQSRVSELNITFIYGGYYAVDTNFWISGFLSGYFILKLLNSNRFSWTEIYIHRYIRITILFSFTMFFFWSFEKYMGNGPLWFLSGTYTKDCKAYWWTTLLYLNNFIPEFKGNSCTGVGWFLAEDMQFFLITPPILYIFYRYSEKISFAIIGLVVAISITTSAIVSYENNLNMVMISEEEHNLIYYYYVKPYCRAAPYAFGLLSGIIIYNQKIKKEWRVYHFFADTKLRWLILIISYLLINFLIFIQYTAYSHPGKDFKFKEWSKNENIAWISLNKLLYSASITGILLPCLLGYFDWIKNILSHPLWTPFAKLTFAVYLIHLYVIDVVVKSQHISYYFGSLTIFSTFVPILVFCYVSALPIAILVEVPAARIEKLIRNKKF